MKNVQLIITGILLIFLVNACSRKTHPSESSSRSVYDTDNKMSATGNTSSVKTIPVKKIKTATPKVIVVNDNVASKTFDGKLYYDLDGHRYWRNYKDGKYYLYNKSMATNPDFKKP